MVDDLFAEPGDQPQPHDDNLLIHGDNLLAFKALEQQYAGKVNTLLLRRCFDPHRSGKLLFLSHS